MDWASLAAAAARIENRTHNPQIVTPRFYGLSYPGRYPGCCQEWATLAAARNELPWPLPGRSYPGRYPLPLPGMSYPGRCQEWATLAAARHELPWPLPAARNELPWPLLEMSYPGRYPGHCILPVTFTDDFLFLDFFFSPPLKVKLQP